MIRKRDFWSEYLEWYELWLEHSPYLQIVLNKIIPLTQGKRSFLDIGAGTGDIALAISEYVSRVTCIEPAKRMRERIIERANRKDCFLTCLDKRWEELDEKEIGSHQLVLAAHSFYQMKNLRKALTKMLKITEQQLIIMVRAQKQPGKLWEYLTKEIQRQGIRMFSQVPKPSLEDVCDYLRELNCQPQIEIVEYSSNYYYHSLEQGVKHWLFYLELEQNQENLLKKLLTEILIYEKGHFFLPETSQGAFVLVDKQRGLDNDKGFII